MFYVAGFLKDMGMSDQVALAFAHKNTKALGIEMNKGTVSKKEILAVLETYKKSKTSKYRGVAGVLYEEVMNGINKGEYREIVSEGDPFAMVKILDAVITYAKSKNDAILLDFIERSQVKVREQEDLDSSIESFTRRHCCSAL